MDEMSQKFFSKLGVRGYDDIIINVQEKNGEGGSKHFVDNITSCNKVGVKKRHLLTKYLKYSEIAKNVLLYSFHLSFIKGFKWGLTG